nr:4'-phosphopantetheinyl transferase superfamily protein [Kibdelosporangium sp. MJ126-NF4]
MRAGVHVTASPLAELADAAPLPVDVRCAHGIPQWCRQDHLAARILLRRLLAELTDDTDDTAGSPIAARAHGGPYLVHRPEIGISLSYTDGWAAAAVHLDGAVGVDVQAAVHVGDRMVRRCCTAATSARLGQLPGTDRAVEFAWMWSVQEACVKSTGAGLADRPWTIPVGIGQHTGRWRTTRWAALRGRWPVAVSCAYDIRTAGGGACVD